MPWIPFLAGTARRHLPGIAVSLTALILVILGPFLSRGMKAVASPFPWPVRYGIFVVFATVGSGIITYYGVSGVTWMLRGLPDRQLLGAIAGTHLALAWLLKRENHI